jgi:hypothetical protein
LPGGGEDLGPQNPQVRSGVVGRVASTAAATVRLNPATSVSMCPASASSARLPDTMAPMISTTRIVEEIARTIVSRCRAPDPVGMPCPWPWPC